MILLAFICLACALVPAVLFCANLALYRPPPASDSAHTLPSVSILIPARNEASAIAAALHAALQSRDVEFEIVVMDDNSTDGTAAIVRDGFAYDPRVRLEQAPPLAPGWNGKQHACWALAHAARFPVLCFVDADVRLAPDCIARMATLLERRPSALVSGFPRQATESALEWLLLPLIHFVLLGFLPIGSMRRGTSPGFAAGCGQFMMVRREAYFAAGGHSAIRSTMHDGLLLPRLLRSAGCHTDLADLTDLATCRMYTNSAEVWSGLAKNATEGLGAPARIVPITLLLLLGQVAPFAVVAFCIVLLFFSGPLGVVMGSLGMDIHVTDPHQLLLFLAIMTLAALSGWVVRLSGAIRFRQDWRSALLHPVGISVLLALQWYALVRKLRGGAVSWRGRAYAGE